MYLLVAAVLMAFYAFLPVAGFAFDGNNFELSLIGIENLSSDDLLQYGTVTVTPIVVSWPLFVMALLVALLSLMTIFKFKQLKLQRTLCGVCIVLTVALMVSLVVLVNGWTDVRYYFSNCMPILAIVAYILAIRGIVKDQKTLSSYDRLR